MTVSNTKKRYTIESEKNETKSKEKGGRVYTREEKKMGFVLLVARKQTTEEQDVAGALQSTEEQTRKTG